MFCYGKKEPWYKAKVPSGMLPALELDGKLITESDVILHALESTFGVLHRSMVRLRLVGRMRLLCTASPCHQPNGEIVDGARSLPPEAA